MTTHPDLLALLRGELSNPLVVEAGDHLDDCPDCRRELAELATANAMLLRSARTLEAPVADRGGVPALPPLPPFRRRRRRALGLAAAAAAVVLVTGTAVAVTRGDDSARARQRPRSAQRSTRSRVLPAAGC